ncbi:hypothetical protein TNCV_4538121 [Trichonephila clavipes]|nr:hypothetical protein TNCV_4538121 [Trichonephila clavipes]
MVAQRLTQITHPAATPDHLDNVWKLLGLLYPKNTSKVSLNQCRDCNKTDIKKKEGLGCYATQIQGDHWGCNISTRSFCYVEFITGIHQALSPYFVGVPGGRRVLQPLNPSLRITQNLAGSLSHRTSGVEIRRGVQYGDPLPSPTRDNSGRLRSPPRVLKSWLES